MPDTVERTYVNKIEKQKLKSGKLHFYSKKKQHIYRNLYKDVQKFLRYKLQITILNANNYRFLQDWQMT